MRYSGGGEPSDDLVQVASVGLMGAIDRFDPARGVPFAGFAGPTILGELRRHFRDRVWTLRVPRGLQERIRSVEDAITKLASELERSPTVAEVAETIGRHRGRGARGDGGRRRPADRLARPARDRRRQRRLDRSSIVSAAPTPPTSWSRRARRSPTAPGCSPTSSARSCACASSRTSRSRKIADQVGYSQMHVSRILRRALDRLREASAPDGVED